MPPEDFGPIKLLGEQELQDFIEEKKHQDDGLMQEQGQQYDWQKHHQEIRKNYLEKQKQDKLALAMVSEELLDQLKNFAVGDAKMQLHAAIVQQQDHYLATLDALEFLKKANLELMEEKRLRELKDEASI